jgi:hypothetical protein
MWRPLSYYLKIYHILGHPDGINLEIKHLSTDDAGRQNAYLFSNKKILLLIVVFLSFFFIKNQRQ